MHFARKTMILIAVAALLSAPASATWYAYGSFEPDTRYDQSSMFVDPPNATEERVYFTVTSNTFYGTASVNQEPSLNPNVGLLHTQIETPGSERHTGFLGVWMDCNGDGYVGLAESALREYSSELLVSDDVCPPVTGLPAARWPAGAYNYNGWVSEFIPILRNFANATDTRAYTDPEARMWGDFHRPDEKPFHRSCALTPQPRGTYHSTGGFVNYFDCRVDLLGPANDVFTLTGDPLGLRFADEDDARTGTLGQVPLGGDESDENAAVRTYECDADPAVFFHSGDTLNQTPIGPSAPATLQNRTASVPAVSPSTGDTDSPTIAGQLNRTMEEWNGDCDTSNDFGHDLYNGVCVSVCVGERDFNGVNPKNKLEADWNFGTTIVLRGGAPFSALGPPTPLSFNGAAGVPQDGGLGRGTGWIADSTWLSKTGPRSVRVDLENGGIAIAPAFWLSFYARVGSETAARGFEMPPGGGVYGSWHCGENESGIHNGWNCNQDLWYQNPDGSFPSDPDAILAKVGWEYDLRDVDCYDGRIGDTGLGVEPAFYGAEPCIPVS